MNKDTLYLPRYGWRIELFTDFDCEDTEIVLQALENIDCSEELLQTAMFHLWECEKNTGLTYTNVNYRQSVAVVYKTTSRREFVNTLSHEIAHICAHVTKAFLIKLTEEEFCEMVGDLMAETTNILLETLCKCKER